MQIHSHMQDGGSHEMTISEEHLFDRGQRLSDSGFISSCLQKEDNSCISVYFTNTHLLFSRTQLLSDADTID